MKNLVIRAFRLVVLALSLPLLLAMVAFNAQAQTSTAYDAYQQPMPVVKATVVGVRIVQLNAPSPAFGPGQLIGTSLGGLVGGLVGHSAKNPAVAGIAGAIGSVVGGYAGTRVGSTSATGEAQEVILRKDDGQMIAITQSVGDGIRFTVGQPVIVIGTGRIAPAM